MSTLIRSSNQLFIDADLDHKFKKSINLSPGTSAGDAVEFSQMNTAIGNAVSGLGSALHEPVADLNASKSVDSLNRSDKMLMLVETLGLYRFDAESSATSNDNTIIRPTDIGSDASPGRWVKISTSITDHDNLSNISGNGTYHLSLSERDKLKDIEALADVTDAQNVGSAISGSSTKTSLLDADIFAILDSSTGNILSKFSWLNLKNQFFALFSGDITSTSSGVTTIGSNKVDNSKLSTIATASFKGRISAGTGNVEDLTIEQAKALLGLTSANTSTRTYRITPDGVINGSNAIFTISANVLSGTEEIFKNGMLMNAGSGNDYTISYGATTTITFATAPSASGFTDVILANFDS